MESVILNLQAFLYIISAELLLLGTEESQENWGSQRKGKHKSLKLVRMNFFLQLSQPLYYGSSAGFWEDGYAVGYIPCTLTQFWMKNVIPYV